MCPIAIAGNVPSSLKVIESVSLCVASESFVASYGPLLCIISCTFVDVTENGLAEKQLYVQLQSNIVFQVFIHFNFQKVWKWFTDYSEVRTVWALILRVLVSSLIRN